MVLVYTRRWGNWVNALNASKDVRGRPPECEVIPSFGCLLPSNCTPFLDTKPCDESPQIRPRLRLFTELCGIVRNRHSMREPRRFRIEREPERHSTLIVGLEVVKVGNGLLNQPMKSARQRITPSNKREVILAKSPITTWPRHDPRGPAGRERRAVPTSRPRSSGSPAAAGGASLPGSTSRSPRPPPPRRGG